jgi:hypothetical protein
VYIESARSGCVCGLHNYRLICLIAGASTLEIDPRKPRKYFNKWTTGAESLLSFPPSQVPPTVAVRDRASRIWSGQCISNV